MNFRLTVTDVTEQNTREKYFTAVKKLAKAMKVPLSIKPKTPEARGEEFPYKAYEQLVDRWRLQMGAMYDELYAGLCRILDLPNKTTFSKSTTVGEEPLQYKGKLIYNPETGKPMTQKDWDTLVKVIEKFLSRNLRDAEKQFILDSHALGRMLSRMVRDQGYEAVRELQLEKLNVEKRSYDWFSKEVRNLRKYFNLSEYDAVRLQLSEQTMADHIADIDHKTKQAIRETIREGIKQKKSKSAVSQDLFDNFGDLNKDWQRIIEYEMNTNLNEAFVQEEVNNTDLGEKIYFERFEVLDGSTCKFCRKMMKPKPLIVLYVPEPLEDENINDQWAKKAIWPGKSRIGKKSNDEWIPEGSAHPWCRGGWNRWYPPMENELEDIVNEGLSKLGTESNAWAEALKVAETEFRKKGIKRPDDDTPGYLNRVNELYKNILHGGTS